MIIKNYFWDVKKKTRKDSFFHYGRENLFVSVFMVIGVGREA